MANGKVTPEMLGKGLARGAGRALSQRQQQLDCQERGGKWRNGKCMMNPVKNAKFE